MYNAIAHNIIMYAINFKNYRVLYLDEVEQSLLQLVPGETHKLRPLCGDL